MILTFFCCIFSISCFISRLMIRIWIWLLSEMPFSYIQFLNANPSEVYRPQGSIWKWVIAITCSAWTMYWQENTSKILPFLGMFFFFFDCPHIPLKVDLGKKGLHTVCLNLKQTCELRIIKSCWVDYNSDKRKNIRQTS